MDPLRFLPLAVERLLSVVNDDTFDMAAFFRVIIVESDMLLEPVAMGLLLVVSIILAASSEILRRMLPSCLFDAAVSLFAAQVGRRRTVQPLFSSLSYGRYPAAAWHVLLIQHLSVVLVDKAVCMGHAKYL